MEKTVLWDRLNKKNQIPNVPKNLLSGSISHDVLSIIKFLKLGRTPISKKIQQI